MSKNKNALIKGVYCVKVVTDEEQYLDRGMEDPGLLDKIVEGDISAYEKTFRVYYGDLYGYGLKLCGNPDLVKDVIQELFAMIWMRRQEIGHIRSLKVYLLVVLRRKIFKVQKDKQLERNALYSYSWEPDIMFTAEEIIIENESASELREKLREALNSLPSRQREVIYLRFYNGMSYEEIEEILSINYQSVRNHVYRALVKLREIMQKDVPTLFALLLIFRGLLK